MDPKPADELPRSGATLLSIVAIVLAVFLLLGGLWYVFFISASNSSRIAANQRASDLRWCAVIRLITASPVPKPPRPAANPSREGQYELYEDFLTLKRQFGC